MLDRRRFIKTGAFRPPRKGEFYLSGALPAVYLARADMEDARDIMRPSAPEEEICACCGLRLPDARK